MKNLMKGGAPMKDQDIVGLYWDRNEDAIHQTQMKYGAYLSKVSFNILADFEDSKECVFACEKSNRAGNVRNCT